MQLNTEHQVTLNTNHCAALLSAAKLILDKYDEMGGENKHQDALQEAVSRIADGMGLSPEKAAGLMHFMATGER